MTQHGDRLKLRDEAIMSQTPDKKATQRDVARLAGVSPMTVSRVIQGLRSVVPATAERVRDAINKLQYVPDPMLSALAAYRTHGVGKGHGNVIAFLDCDDSHHSRVTQPRIWHSRKAASCRHPRPNATGGLIPLVTEHISRLL